MMTARDADIMTQWEFFTQHIVRGSTYASEEVNIVYKHIMYDMQYVHDIVVKTYL